jgi:hypothetical protein
MFSKFQDNTRRELDLDKLVKDGRLVSSQDGDELLKKQIVAKVGNMLGIGKKIDRKSLYRSLTLGKPSYYWSQTLSALGIPPAQYEDFLLPRDRRKLDLVGFDEAAARVAGWRGNPADWPLGGDKSPDIPLQDLALLRLKSKAQSKGDFLLLQAYVACKMGEPGVEAYFELGYKDNILGHLALDKWRCAAAHYLLGNLYTTRSVSGFDTSKHFRDAKIAYDYWDKINTVTSELPLLLPGLLSETDNINKSSDSPRGAIDPRADEVPRPDRYLAASAIRLAYLFMRSGDNERTEHYLNQANAHVHRAGVELNPSITFRALNLRLCRSMVGLLEACRKRSSRLVQRGLQKEFDALRVSLDTGYQGEEVSRVKFLEWMANVDFSEFALKKILKKLRPNPDKVFIHLREAAAEREGRGSPVFRFDPIFQFPLEDDPDLMSEFLRIIMPAAPG